MRLISFRVINRAYQNWPFVKNLDTIISLRSHPCICSFPRMAQNSSTVIRCSHAIHWAFIALQHTTEIKEYKPVEIDFTGSHLTSCLFWNKPYQHLWYLPRSMQIPCASAIIGFTTHSKCLSQCPAKLELFGPAFEFPHGCPSPCNVIIPFGLGAGSKTSRAGIWTDGPELDGPICNEEEICR